MACVTSRVSHVHSILGVWHRYSQCHHMPMCVENLDLSGDITWFSEQSFIFFKRRWIVKIPLCVREYLTESLQSGKLNIEGDRVGSLACVGVGGTERSYSLYDHTVHHKRSQSLQDYITLSLYTAER